MHALGPERIGGEHRHQRGVDAARQAEHDALEAVLLDIVAQPQHAGGVVFLVGTLPKLRNRPADAAPAVAGTLPAHRRHLFAKRRKLERQRAVGVQPERGAVEDELVLAADLVDIDDRQVAFGHARDRDVEPDIVLVAPIGRAVGHHQKLRAGLRQRLDDILVVAPVGPDVFADRNPEAHAAKVDRAGRRPRSKHATLVEHAIVRQVDFQAHGGNRAAVEQAAAVVELAVLEPGRADEHRRAGIGGFARKLLDLGPAGRLEGRLEHEVFGRIAGDEQLRERHDVGAVAGGLGARAAHLVGIAGDVAHRRIGLGDRDRQAVGGTGIHAFRSSASAGRPAIGRHADLR